jgi:competence protein ComEC
VVRAVIMATIFLFANVVYRRNDTIASLSAASIILLTYNPYILYDVGFQLSFVATLSIIFLYTPLSNRIKIPKVPKVVNETIAGTLAAQIGVTPIIIYHFNIVFLLSLFTNILVVPITGFITILGMIMVGVSIISDQILFLVANINNILLSFILIVTRYTSEFENSMMVIPTPSIVTLLIYYCVITYLLMLERYYILRDYYKTAFIIIVLALSANFGAIYIDNDFTVTFLDVGEGDSAIISTESRKRILVDGGGYMFSKLGKKDMGEVVVVPYLLDKGIVKIDIIISTHSDADHLAGLYTVLSNIKVDKVLIPKLPNYEKYFEFIELAEDKGVEVIECHESMKIKVDNNTILDIINPEVDNSDMDVNDNNESIAFNLVHDNRKILFCGDIEKEAEERLIRDEVDIDADILKVSHHGSKSSSTEEFLDEVTPQLAIISVGPNFYGHPYYKVLDRLDERNIRVLRTDINGAITVKIDDNKIFLDNR